MDINLLIKIFLSLLFKHSSLENFPVKFFSFIPTISIQIKFNHFYFDHCYLYQVEDFKYSIFKMELIITIFQMILLIHQEILYFYLQELIMDP
jgi:hypothetical protein